jgi:hypothetical protein
MGGLATTVRSPRFAAAMSAGASRRGVGSMLIEADHDERRRQDGEGSGHQE